MLRYSSQSNTSLDINFTSNVEPQYAINSNNGKNVTNNTNDASITHSEMGNAMPEQITSHACLLIPMCVFAWWYWTKRQTQKVVLQICEGGRNFVNDFNEKCGDEGCNNRGKCMFGGENSSVGGKQQGDGVGVDAVGLNASEGSPYVNAYASSPPLNGEDYARGSAKEFPYYDHDLSWNNLMTRHYDLWSRLYGKYKSHNTSSQGIILDELDGPGDEVV